MYSLVHHIMYSAHVVALRVLNYVQYNTRVPQMIVFGTAVLVHYPCCCFEGCHLCVVDMKTAHCKSRNLAYTEQPQSPAI